MTAAGAPARLRIAVDIGGTFTDAGIETDGGEIGIYKAASVPDDPIVGVLAALDHAGRARGTDRHALLAAADTFIYTGTKAINAIVTGQAARTAFVTTAGHPDVLLLREGGRAEPFNYTTGFPAPLVPRRLTFEVGGRIDAGGHVVTPLDAASLDRLAAAIAREEVQAVGVCLLWAIVNPAHELAVGRFLEQRFPDLPVTLSHQLNPCLREYRRASSACIDASLKPVMSRHLADFEARLRAEGFAGTALAVTSQGGVMPMHAMARAPIHALNSGPSMAPVCGRSVARQVCGADDAIVIDAGGTTFDVSLVAAGQLPATQELWIGGRYSGHITGFASVDVRSVGAGGGSIAHVDEGGLLHVGPASAGATPGPACYGRGGAAPTVTDAALLLGYIDAGHFLGGRMLLDAAAAEAAFLPLAQALGTTLADAALAVMDVAAERMVQAIEEVTIDQGVDPAGAVLVAGGGSAGFRAVELGRRMGCSAVLFPAVGPALSAVGALLSDLLREHRITSFGRLSALTADDLGRLGQALQARVEAVAAPAAGTTQHVYFFEGRYERQIWEIEVSVGDHMPGAGDLAALRAAFDRVHAQLYGLADARSEVEIVSWGVRSRTAQRSHGTLPALAASASAGTAGARTRVVTFTGLGAVEVPVLDARQVLQAMQGPLIVETDMTTIVVPPGCEIVATPHGLQASWRGA